MKFVIVSISGFLLCSCWSFAERCDDNDCLAEAHTGRTFFLLNH